MKKFFLLIAIVAILFSAICNAQIGYIYTFANIATCNVALDNAGILYTADGYYVYRVDSGGHTTVVAGGGSMYGDGGPATAAMLNQATNLTFDRVGNMYIADAGYGVVRKVDPSGVISTIAGSRSLGKGYTGDGGAATAARLNGTDICLDVSGNLYIADDIHNVIRKVNSSGIISTVAGNGSRGYTGDGGPATAAKLKNLTERGMWGIATDLAGNLYLSTGDGYRVRKVDAAGMITTIAGNGAPGKAGIGGPATAANIYYPEGLATDAAGNLYIAEWQNSVLEVVK